MVFSSLAASCRSCAENPLIQTVQFSRATSLAGGRNDDTYGVSSLTDVITEAANDGTDEVISAITYTLGTNLENLTLSDTGNINGTGNGLNNTITGNSGNNALAGDEGNDTLYGGSGNDTLYGGNGNDMLYGGLGDDDYVVESLGDRVIEAADQGTDKVSASITYTLAESVENLQLTSSGSVNGTGNSLNNILTGAIGANALYGLDGDDTLFGGAGNDTLYGGAGGDSMVGGANADTYVVDSLYDIVVEDVGGGNDTVEASISYILRDNVENLVLTGADNLTGTGNVSNNTIIGTSGNNALYGADGADTLLGGQGNDTLDGGADGDDLNGGLGDDIYIVDRGNDVVVENANEGVDTVYASASYSLSDNVENLILTGTLGLLAFGNALNNTITGTASNDTIEGYDGNDTLDGGDGNDSMDGFVGNDTLNGGAGDDQLWGGLGNDIFFVDSTGDIITEFEGQGDDTVLSSVSYVLGWNIENLTLTGTGDTTCTGNDLSNVITGNSGNNSLNGGSSNDTLYGGAGNDTLIGGGNSDALYGGLGDDDYGVEFSGDRVIEAADQGTDQVRSSITYTLGVNLENLILVDTGNINGTGNSLNNTITGNSGNNAIAGEEGNDSLYGGSGNDTLYGGGGVNSLAGGLGDDTYGVNATSDVITEVANEGTDEVISAITYTLGANLENLTLSDTSSINGTGNSLNNTITGNSGNNALSGEDGNDTLYGGQGNDTLYGGGGVNRLAGGLGDDTYGVSSLTDVITEAVNEGTDQVIASITYTLGANLENLTLSDTGNINGTGNGLNNTITGNSGNNALAGEEGDDTLYGGSGNDTLYGGGGVNRLAGGLGDDSYVVNSTSDVITEAANKGIDSVESSVSYTLSGNVENLTLTGVNARDGTGNSLANTLTGTAADNALTGLNGADRLFGNDGNDTLYGGAGADVLFGGDGADLLKGGGGGDVMTGGDGNDSYYVDSISDQVNETGTSGHDRVYSLSSFTLSQGVEDLKLIGSTGISGTGNALDNSIFGSRGSNALFGQSGADTLYGGAGEDTLDGGDGADRMAGGADNDIYVVDNAADVVVEYRGKGSDVVKACVSYALSANVEALELTGTVAINGTGNGGGNKLTGNAGDNDLTGLGGHDTLVGGDGDDHLAGGSGNDELTGGTGADVFIFDRFGGLDHVTDFISGQDHIQISAHLIAALGGAQALRATCFYAASGAVTGHDADDRLVYNTSTGALYVDVDGSGKRAAVQIAVLDPAENAVPALSFADFIFS